MSMFSETDTESRRGKIIDTIPIFIIIIVLMGFFTSTFYGEKSWIQRQENSCLPGKFLEMVDGSQNLIYCQINGEVVMKPLLK